VGIAWNAPIAPPGWSSIGAGSGGFVIIAGINSPSPIAARPVMQPIRWCRSGPGIERIADEAALLFPAARDVDPISFL
jgi:hypothetical protein